MEASTQHAGLIAVADGASVRESIRPTSILDNRRRIGANFAIRSEARCLYFLLSQCLFHGTFPRLPRDLIRIIVYYHIKIAQSCIHAFVPCPVCNRARCMFCGVRFFTSGRDQRACTCKRPMRTSGRIANKRFAAGQQRGDRPGQHAALHLRYPALYSAAFE